MCAAESVISFPANTEPYKFTHAYTPHIDADPLFWHINGSAWVRGEADAGAMAQWLYWMGGSIEAVERLEGVAG